MDALRQPRGGETVVDRGPIAEGPGTWIGPYRILQQIGEGGFGVVYMAEQQTPVQRKVALKIIKLGMDTKQVIARFEAERQALALMDHPNIARVLDAGATESGRPYFVMELVKGVPLSQYCDTNRLSTRERIELFLNVCRAVQHAHQKGIIHRDLKPSNVLVTLHDTRPVPKIIDFGIAKATNRHLTEKTLFTEFRQLIGTPEYMSPDQADISGLDVDTRTDIYSLGVILYELLTGTTPFDSETLRRAGHLEIQRIIREVDPPKPSTRMQTLATLGDGQDIARQRSTEPATLSRMMRGDLDWIVMRAMEKDRTRRYQSAGELVSDLGRYLGHQPVLAGPPSVTYKVRKFVQRHRLGVSAAALIVSALLTGSTAATVGLVQARQEATRSQKIADFLQYLCVSTAPDEAIARAGDVEHVLATAREVFGDDHATVAATLSSRALQLQSSGDLEDAETLYRRSLDLWRLQDGDERANIAATMSRLGLLLLTKGDDTASERALREALEIMEQNRPEDVNTERAQTMAIMASVLANRGEYDEARALLRESIRIRRAVAPDQRLQLALTISSLTNLVIMAGDDTTLAILIPEALAAWRAALPPRTAFLGRVLAQIGDYYLDQDELEEAERLLRESLDIFRETGEPPNQHRALAVRSLLRVLLDQERAVEAIPIAIEMVDLSKDFNRGQSLDQALRNLAGLAWRVAIDPERPRED
ncbi:MAG: serine/threonine-protein kinase, partial [Planctomycetota bacterium]|jgi:serine/threonine protein kinase